MGADELLRSQAHVFRHVLAHMSSMSLKCAVELRIPDIVHAHGHPITAAELASALRLSTSKTPGLRRLMRTLTHFGFLSHNSSTAAYSLTPASRALLLTASPTSLAACVLGMLDPLATSHLHQLAAWFRSDGGGGAANAAELEHGRSIWEMAAEQPEVQRLLNEAVDGDTKLMLAAAVAERKQAFEGVNILVDVGGGNGTCVRAITEAFPHIKCIVYDLPHVVAAAPKDGSVEFVAGNMFDHIPNADAVLFKVLLHFWTDDDCVKILKLCKEAIPAKGGKVMIVDIVLNASTGDSTYTETQLLWDMFMLASTQGKEREEHEWRRIFIDAGFSYYKITPLGMRSLIEVFP